MIERLSEIMFWQNSALAYLICIGTFFAGSLFIKIIELLVLKRLKVLAEKTTTTIDDFIISIIKKIAVPLAYFGIFYISLNTLTLAPLLKKIIDIVATAVLTLSAVRFGIALLSFGFGIYMSRQKRNESFRHSMEGILRVLKVIIWGLAIVFFLDNLGFKISAVIAGLGIGGVAVALAAQAILGDLFGYFAILFDRPFEIGDFIIIEDYLGTIEHIGIKTTRVRSLGGEQLVFSNKDLTNSRVRNYKRMQQRRVVFKLGVTYQASLEQVKKIPKIIENIIKSVQDTIFDRAHFFSYGDFALVFEIVYYVLSSDYNKYMDIQQEINVAIKEKFEKEGIEFAYPTQTLYLQKETA